MDPWTAAGVGPPTQRKEINMPYAKAVVGFVLAFLGALIATIEGRPDLENLKVLDWFIIVGSALVTAGGVYQVSNRPTQV